MKQHKTLFAILITIVIVGVTHFVYVNETSSVSVAVPPITNTPPIVASKEVCYFKETTGEESTDDAFTSINYDAGGKVHGIINFIPGEKDSLVGTYTGTVEDGTMAGYPTQLNIIYAAIGEGIVSNQQEIIAVGANDIKTGTGEMVKDTDGVWKIKDLSKVTYDNPMPMVDCSSVAANFQKDYSNTATN